jgi:uncharacterized protein (TIGR02217 family)
MAKRQTTDGEAVMATFPTLSGQGWSVHKKPTFSTIVASHVSGREVREALYANPVWQFELTFDGLDGTSSGAYGGLGASSLQSLMGLYLQCQGQYGSFLFTDPSDSAVAGQALGTGDGATTTFTFQRTLGGFTEPVGWVTSVSNVYLNGVNQTSGWSLTTPNSLVFGTAPAYGAAITATFNYAFLCRFDGDDLDFEQFMANLWRADSVKFRSLRAQ